MTPPAPAPRIVRRLFAAALVTSAVLSLVELASMVRATLPLAGAPLLERARVANDVARNPLPLAGRLRLRDALSHTPRAAADATGFAELWPATLEAERTLPEVARIYLVEPAAGPYYYATTLWHSRHVAVSREPRLVRDEATLAAAAEKLPRVRWGELTRRGFTHVAELERDGWRIVPLAPRP